MGKPVASLSDLLGRLGIKRANAMQEAVWASDASRLVVLSPTGTGKTAAFAAAIVKRVTPSRGICQAVVLAPTRELVIQVHEVVRKVASGCKATALYGKHAMRDEVSSLSVAPDIVVATPGRLLDHLQRQSIDLSAARVLVIDEYDKALAMGFHDEMSKICRRMPSVSSIILTSATPLAETPDFIDLSDAETIDFSGGNTPKSRTHIARVESPARDKLQTLIDLLQSLPNSKVIVFVNHRDSAERVFERLKAEGLPVGLYHGGLEQIDRERAVIQLENASKPIMVATDIAARGLDIAAVGSVIHYHLPPSSEAWTHRNGRTARVDAPGNVFVITSEADSIPDYVVWDADYNPTGHNDDPIRPSGATLHINAGRKEKISRGDIVGFLINNLGLEASEIGKIDLRDHAAYVAVPKACIPRLFALDATKIKGKRVRITPFK